VVEGESEVVQEFLSALGRRMEGYIDGVDVRDQTATGRAGFHVRH
jgi:hypothetical protein